MNISHAYRFCCHLQNRRISDWFALANHGAARCSTRIWKLSSHPSAKIRGDWVEGGDHICRTLLIQLQTTCHTFSQLRGTSGFVSIFPVCLQLYTVEAQKRAFVFLPGHKFGAAELVFSTALVNDPIKIMAIVARKYRNHSMLPAYRSHYCACTPLPKRSLHWVIPSNA